MAGLIGLVRPLAGIMVLAVSLGVIGYLCAIFLTVIAGQSLLQIIQEGRLSGSFLATLVLSAVMRGILHYGEQYCNHFIAFRLLALIRHQVFAVLRRLCPAKLSGKDKGDLISIITSDIELLEVFYAHTISPVAIALIVSVIMTGFIAYQSPYAGVLAACAYIFVGAVIPLTIGNRGAADGLVFRNAFGALNSFVLESLRGVRETIQYGGGDARQKEITSRTRKLASVQKRLSRLEEEQRSFTNLAVLGFSFGMFFLMLHQFQRGNASFSQVLLATTAMMGSFGPVIALSSLANNLNQTLASGERVLSLLEEAPAVEENKDGNTVVFSDAEAEEVCFSYDSEEPERAVLQNFSVKIQGGKVLGIHGPSGCGKSTFLRLLMRFWDTDSGRILLSGNDVRTVKTSSLRETDSYVTQETDLFHDTIANNIGVGEPGASREEIETAAKKASLHEFVRSLPDGYDTVVGEQGSTLSGGERQRIGIARAFLHNAPLMLLDEPTSNLDSLNEGMILRALAEEKKDRTVVLVTHRASTLGIADETLELKGNGRVNAT